MSTTSARVLCCHLPDLEAARRVFVPHLEHELELLLERADNLRWNGMEWDGMGWNGMEWNGTGWNGMEWNGMEWNGMEWNGMEWNGMECK